jgi:hypothetical protein
VERQAEEDWGRSTMTVPPSCSQRDLAALTVGTLVSFLAVLVWGCP